MLGRIRREILRAIRRPATWGQPKPVEVRPGSVDPERIRRWEAADTNRLNKAHWAGVYSRSVNADLYRDLEILRTRAAYEAHNNPLVEGVISTHCVDLVGRDGPSLQVQTDDEAYNEALEALWRKWWLQPTLNPQVAGADLLRLWVRGLWINGEFLAQIVTGGQKGDPVRLRLHPIHPRRLATPPAQAGDADVVLGVRVTREGVPLQYWISDPKRYGAFTLSTGSFSPIPADMILHGFLHVEEDQQRGIPWLACCLQEVADLRDYDAQVLDAARAAADQAVLLHTKHPDAPYIEVNESTEIERRSISTLPPGWEATQLTPQQPSTQYIDYRCEKMSAIGRPVSMPLMIVRLTSQKYNYSSARFDGQVYQRALKVLQAWMARQSLNPLVDAIAREASLSDALLERPEVVRYVWTWPGAPHVDPLKERNAEKVGLETGTLPYGDALAGQGKDLDTTIAQRAAENKKLIAAGLPPIAAGVKQPTPAPPGPKPNPSPPPPPRKPNQEKATQDVSA